MLANVKNNLDLKILSIFLAVGAWIYLRYSPNSVPAARFEQQMSIPITVLGVRPGHVARFTEKQVDVAVSVPRTPAQAIHPEDVRAVLDLGGRDTGAYNVPVQVIAPQLQIDSLSPASITLTVERFEERSAPVAIDYADGSHGRIVVARVATTPPSVVLHGPTSALAQTRAVRVIVALPAFAGRIDAMLRPHAVDANGNDVPDVVISPSLIRVDARFILGRNR